MGMESKPFWRSKTFWFNALAVVVAVAGAFGFEQFHPDPAVGGIAAAIVAVVNLILRIWFTRQPLSGR